MRWTPVALAVGLAFALAVGLGGASCYAPSIDDCQYVCAPPLPGAAQCPEGLVCNAELRCVTNLGMRCEAPLIDAPKTPDAPGDSTMTGDIVMVMDAASPG